jgi:hypothetical protein
MYVPLNRIITNLYTAPGEFVYKNSNAPYNGYYWKSYNGKIFTGKNPNDLPNEELIYTPISQDFIVDNIVAYSEIYNEPIFPAGLIEDGIIIPSDNVPSTLQEYIQIKSIDTTSIKLIPSQYYPTPTQDDYNLGVFSRYFVVKANENVYLEVNKDTFNNILNESSEWAWELYIPFTMLWTLTGERDNVFITNRNITQLTEQRLKRRGLQEFLKLNYLKFYKTNEQNIS